MPTNNNNRQHCRYRSHYFHLIQLFFKHSPSHHFSRLLLFSFHRPKFSFTTSMKAKKINEKDGGAFRLCGVIEFHRQFETIEKKILLHQRVIKLFWVAVKSEERREKFGEIKWNMASQTKNIRRTNKNNNVENNKNQNQFKFFLASHWFGARKLQTIENWKRKALRNYRMNQKKKNEKSYHCEKWKKRKYCSLSIYHGYLARPTFFCTNK